MRSVVVIQLAEYNCEGISISVIFDLNFGELIVGMNRHKWHSEYSETMVSSFIATVNRLEHKKEQ